MKKIFTLITSLLLSSALFAQEADSIKSVPYYMGFENGTTDGIKIFDLNGKNGKNGYWKIMTYTGAYGDYQYFRTGLSALVYFYDSKQAADEWAILDPVRLEPGKYAVKFWYCNYSTEGTPHPERISLHYGSEQTPEAMTTEVVRYDPFDVESYTESVSIVEIQEAGVYCFGFHCFSDKDENIVMIDDVSIEAVTGNDNDIVINDIAYPKYGYLRTDQSQDLNFTISNNGSVNVSAKVNVLLDGETYKTYPVNVPAQQTITQNRSDLLENVPVGTHTLTLTLAHDSDPDQSNNTIEMSFVKVAEPTIVWNAESGVVDYTIVTHCFDNNLSGSTQTDFFPNGIQWNTIAIEKHDVFGEFMYICNTWFSNPKPTDADRWFVLPAVKINDSDAHFTWNAESFNKNYLENYSVMISSEGDVKEAYKPLCSVTGEIAIDYSKHSIRGVSLADYQGKTVNLAIRVTTADGQMLILDNLAIHGNAEIDEASAIETLTTLQSQPSQIYNLRGQRVSSVTFPGIYIVNGKKIFK